MTTDDVFNAQTEISAKRMFQKGETISPYILEKESRKLFIKIDDMSVTITEVNSQVTNPGPLTALIIINTLCNFSRLITSARDFWFG